MTIFMFLSVIEAYEIGCVDLDLSFSILNETTCLYSNQDFHIFPIIEEASSSIINLELDLIFILSSSDIQKQRIIQLYSSHQVPIIVLGKGKNTDWVFFTEPSSECYAKVLIKFLLSQKMYNLGFIWTPEPNHFETAQALKSETFKIKTSSLEKSASQKRVKEIIGKYFKCEGITDYLVMASHRECKKFEESFNELKLEKNWNIVVYSQECVYDIESNGSLILTPLATEYVKTSTEFHSALFEKYIINILGKSLNRFQIAQQLRKVDLKCEYSIINIQNNKRVKIGTVSDCNIILEQQIIYFTGSMQREVVKKPKIQFSANTGSFDPFGRPPALQNARFQDGIYYALSKISTDRNLLDKFELRLFDKILCGVSHFDYNYSKSCYESIKDQLGVAYIPSFYSTTIDTMLQFTDLGIKTPVLAGMGNSPILGNSTMFPTFFRLVSPINHIINFSMVVLRKLLWKNFIMFYSDDNWGTSLYLKYLNIELSGEINIINSLKFRKIPFDFKPQMLKDYKDHIKDAVNSGGNIVFLLMSDPTVYFFLEGLYDYGIRRSDFVYILFTPSVFDQIYSEDGDQAKREELMDGTHMAYNTMWMGEYGYQVQNDYKNFSGKTWLPCFYIDAVFTIAHTLEYLIYQGRDYEDPEEFIFVLRSIRFLGATGVISFEKTGNSRNLYYYGIYNFYQDLNSKKFIGVNKTLVSPLTSQILTLIPSVWPNHGPRPKEMKTKYYNCEVYEKDVIESPKSQLTQLIACLSIISLSFIITLLGSLKIKLTDMQLMSKVGFIQFSDCLQLFFIIIEPIQMLSSGPPIDKINKVISWSAHFFSINLIKVYTMRDESFWNYFYLNLSIGYFWIFLCIASGKYFTFLGKLHRLINSLTSTLTPIMTNYLFIPLITTILNIYSCRFTTKTNENESFLDTDCDYKCWTGHHIYIIILTSILIVVYTPIALIFKADWQNESNKLTIKSSEHYSLIKQMISILLLIVQTPLRKKSNLAFALLFIVCLFIILLYTFKRNAYNYDRANLWNKITLCCAIWNTAVYILSLKLEIQIFWYSIIGIFGWILLIFIGAYLHKRLPPNMLLVKEKNTVKMMLRFAFNMGMFTSNRYRVRRMGSSGPVRRTPSLVTTSKK